MIIVQCSIFSATDLAHRNCFSICIQLGSFYQPVKLNHGT